MVAYVLQLKGLGQGMTTRGDTIVRLVRGEGPLSQANDGEPVFILRAQDKFFVPLVRLWVELVEMDTAQPISERVSRKIMEAIEIANKALDWQETHRDRVKVPD